MGVQIQGCLICVKEQVTIVCVKGHIMYYTNTFNIVLFHVHGHRLTNTQKTYQKCFVMSNSWRRTVEMVPWKHAVLVVGTETSAH